MLPIVKCPKCLHCVHLSGDNLENDISSQRGHITSHLLFDDLSFPSINFKHDNLCRVRDMVHECILQPCCSRFFEG